MKWIVRTKRRLTIQCKMSDYQVIKKSRPSHEAFVSGSLRYSFMDLYCVCMINCSTTFYNQDGSFHYLSQHGGLRILTVSFRMVIVVAKTIAMKIKVSMGSDSLYYGLILISMLETSIPYGLDLINKGIYQSSSNMDMAMFFVIFLMLLIIH